MFKLICSLLFIMPLAYAQKVQSNMVHEEVTESACDAIEAPGTPDNAMKTACKMLKKIGIIDGGAARCVSCHGATYDQAKLWTNAAISIAYGCIEKEDMADIDRVNCLRSNPLNPNSPFTAAKLGFYALHTRSQVFADLFKKAYPNDLPRAEALHKEFIASASMPPRNPVFEGTEADEIIAWVRNDMPLADAIVKPEQEKPCVPFISPELKNHILQMRTSGWSVKNEENGMVSFGCGLESDPLKCFTTAPDITAANAAPGVAQKIVTVHNRDKRSYFWFRASPDGRYLGFGGTYGANSKTIAEMVDLNAYARGQNSVVQFDTTKEAFLGYTDPVFLPDNTGFAFTALNQHLQSLCQMSLVDDGLVTPGTVYDLIGNPKCASNTEGWYNSWGASLDGLSYWMVSGNFIADDAQYSAEHPIPASSNYRTDIVRLNEMKTNGLTYKSGRAAGMSVKGLVDMITSPSALILNNRFGANATQSGFQLRKIVPDFDADGGSLHFPKIGEYCGFGGKAAFSFDERFLTFHQYPEPWRGGDQVNLPGNTSNVVVLDLLTGVSTRITQVPAGYQALFPHFRSDGWIYFVLREPGGAKESIVASDFAIRASMVPVSYE